MKKGMKKILLIVLVLSMIFNATNSFAGANDNSSVQEQNKYTNLTAEEIIKILSTDATLEGRQAGSKGYMKAAEVVANKFKEEGLITLFNDSYLQKFKSTYANVDKINMSINGTELKLLNDFMPFSRTSSSNITSNELVYSGSGVKNSYDKINVKNKIVIFKWYDSNGKFPEGASDRVIRAKEKGAKAVFIVTNGLDLTMGNYEHPVNGGDIGLPVMYISENIASKLGVPSNDLSKGLPKNTINIKVEISRTKSESANIVGLLEGKSEHKAILIVSNLDGIGTLPGGITFQTAKMGSANIGTFIKLIDYYKKNKPEFNIIFALVGDKYTNGEGVNQLSQMIDFNKMEGVIDLYASGGEGKPWINYISNETNKYCETIGNLIDRDIIITNDVGNGSATKIKEYTNKIWTVRDRGTWINKVIDDTFNKVKNIDGLVKEIANIVNAMETTSLKEIPFIYDDFKIKNYTTDFGKKYLTTESQCFEVLFDKEYRKYINQTFLREIDSIYDRISTANYHPAFNKKIKLILSKDVISAAKIAGRQDIIDGHNPGGGFAGFDLENQVIQANEVFYSTISHELNHALANYNKSNKDVGSLEESQGHTFIIDYKESKDNMINSRFIGDEMELCHADEGVIDSVKRINFDWNWIAKERDNPDGHISTYFFVASFYNFIDREYGYNAYRRAMYKAYDAFIDGEDVGRAISSTVGMTSKQFYSNWKKWLLSNGNYSSSSKVSFNKLTGYDYAKIFLNDRVQNNDSNSKDSGSGIGKLVKGTKITRNQTTLYSFESQDEQFTSLDTKGLLDFFGIAEDNKNIYIRLKGNTLKTKTVTLFLAGDRPGLKESIPMGNHNEVIIMLSKEMVSNFGVPIAINLGGDGKFLFVNPKTD